MKAEAARSCEYWNKFYGDGKSRELKTDNWLEQFKKIINICDKPVIDLGCGSGDTAQYLIEQGKKVIACDQSENAIEIVRRRCPSIYGLRRFDMTDGLPFNRDFAGIIVADLCLHYFRECDTLRIVDEIKRVLVYGGTLLLRVNSIKDINYGAGKGSQVEKHLFLTEDGRIKRFFSLEDMDYYFKGFKILHLSEDITYRYGLEKNVLKACLCSV